MNRFILLLAVMIAAACFVWTTVGEPKTPAVVAVSWLVAMLLVMLLCNYRSVRQLHKKLSKKEDNLESVEACQRQQAVALDCVKQELAAEIASRRQVESALHTIKNDLELQVACVNRMQSHFIADVGQKEFFKELLSDILKFTRSEFGFIAEVAMDKSGDPFWHTEVFSYPPANGKTVESAPLKGLLAAPVSTGVAVIANAPADDPREDGLPAGHPPLTAFLGLPIKWGLKVTGVVGLANREGGYDASVVDYLQPVLASCAQIIDGYGYRRRRDEAEKAVREREAQYRTLFESAPDAILLTDPISQTILDANAAAVRLLGKPLEQIKGMSHLSLYPPLLLSQCIVNIQEKNKMAVGSPCQSFESQVVGAGGKPIPVEVTETMVTFGGVSVWQGSFRNISRRKRLEEEMAMAKEAAEAANRSKSNFLATMSHDIRAPLNTILGIGELLLEGPVTEQQRYYLQIQHRAGECLLALVNDILDLSKIEAGQLELNPVPMDLHQLAEDTLAMFRVDVVDKPVQLASVIGENVSRWVVGDPQRLQQVLINLLGNAIKFTEKGRVVLEVSCFSPNVYQFAVRDTGVGIAPHRHRAIFQPFSQESSDTVHRYGGTGLGLSICRQLVACMEGNIWLESTPGEGSVFYFTAPLPDATCRKETIAQSTIPAPEASGKVCDLRIMVVDDAEDNRLLIQAFLAKEKHRITMAVDGGDAITKFHPDAFDLIFMDIQMPDMDGYQVTQNIRHMEKQGGALPATIVALTGYASQSDVGRALEAGCNYHLTKPIRKSQLLQLINKIVLLRQQATF